VVRRVDRIPTRIWRQANPKYFAKWLPGGLCTLRQGPSPRPSEECPLKLLANRGQCRPPPGPLPEARGGDLRQRSLEGRRDALLRRVAGVDNILFSEALAAKGAVVFAKACQLGLEESVSKRMGGRYWSGNSRQSLTSTNRHFEADRLTCCALVRKDRCGTREFEVLLARESANPRLCPWLHRASVR
jgi:hypothetical protein